MKRLIIITKLYAMRAFAYISLFNSLMIVQLLVKQYGLHPLVTIPLGLGLLGVAVLFGYTETKLGFWDIESTIYNKRNPEIMEILTILREMKKEREGK